MGLINKFLNRNPTVQVKMVTEVGNGFYAWDGKVYKSDIVRACIRPKAKAIGKLSPKHIKPDGKEDLYIKLLLEEPNPMLTGQMLQEKVATQLQLNNNAFIYVVRDENGRAVELYPIIADLVEAVYIHSELYLKFTMKNGKYIQIIYSDIIHLRQDLNENDIFGEHPKEALSALMDIATTTDQGIVKAIKNSMAIRWLLKFKSTLRPEDKEDEVNKFVNAFLSVQNGSGVAATDPKYDAERVENNSYVPNAAQMDKTVQRIFSFFGTNEKIIQSKYSEDEWNAYYEAEIEPVALQLSNEFSRKLFSRKQRADGEKIIFESSNLQYASMKTKLNLMQMVDRGAMVPNEWRKIFGNLAPLPGGDKPIRRLDTAVVEGGEDNSED